MDCATPCQSCQALRLALSKLIWAYTTSLKYTLVLWVRLTFWKNNFKITWACFSKVLRWSQRAYKMSFRNMPSIFISNNKPQGSNKWVLLYFLTSPYIYCFLKCEMTREGTGTLSSFCLYYEFNLITYEYFTAIKQNYSSGKSRDICLT